MLDQLQLWDRHPSRCRAWGTVRGYLQGLEPCTASMPIWRDELYLELHRGCATSRPDQKRHNRTLERLLREADLVEALGAAAMPARDWPTLLFQQFHDILPGTSIPEVFDQAESQWRRARRLTAAARTEGLRCLLDGKASVPRQPPLVLSVGPGGLQPLQRWSRFGGCRAVIGAARDAICRCSRLPVAAFGSSFRKRRHRGPAARAQD